MRFFTILFAIMTIGFMTAQIARAQDDPFTVTGVKVDVTAGNAVDARTQAFGQAQQAAFVQLAQHFLASDQMKAFQAPAAEQITPLVNDFEVTNEQLSNVRYVGTYTFRFRPAPSRALIVARAPAAIMPPDQVAGGAIPLPDDKTEDKAAVPATAIAKADDGVWQGSAAMPAVTPSVTVRAHYATLPEWVAAQRALRQTPGVKGVQILTVSPVQAMVALRYQGNADTLRPVLMKSGYSLALTENNAAYDMTSAMAGATP